MIANKNYKHTKKSLQNRINKIKKNNKCSYFNKLRIKNRQNYKLKNSYLNKIRIKNRQLNSLKISMKIFSNNKSKMRAKVNFKINCS